MEYYEVTSKGFSFQDDGHVLKLIVVIVAQLCGHSKNL